jgi:3-oxoacyl-[acyl-carrier protein] reductase
MNMKHASKIAAITGAGNGIGRSAAELFAAEGAHVIIMDIDDAGGQTVAKNIP